MSTSGNKPGRTPPQVVPTLTEVVRSNAAASPPAPAAAAASPRAPARAPATPARTAAVPAAAAAAPPASQADADEQALVQRVLAEAMRQAGPIVERRLRLALAPALAQLADAFVQNARTEITRSVQEALEKALEQELARRKPR
jgi:hypothetical protein